MPPPTGLAADEIGVIGFSNVGTYLQGYQSLSSNDWVQRINHGGITGVDWGTSGTQAYTNAWAKVTDEQPVGGYRGFWVCLGFQGSGPFDAETLEGYADHIATRLANTTDFPSIEWTWWSPMNTYFTTNPGDGDAADLLTHDPWGTNPGGLQVVSRVEIDPAVEASWVLTQYAVAQGYADDYGPWVNLIDAMIGPDNRHPTEGLTEGTGQNHGGAVLLDFFENQQAGTIQDLGDVARSVITRLH